MEKESHRALDSEEDYFKWDSYIAQLNEIELSINEKVQITSAIDFLRKVLCEDFLQEAFKNYHPFLNYYLLNSAPWVRRSLYRFVAILKSFEKSPHFENLIKKIRRPGGFVEAHSVLEIGYKFFRAKFDVSFDSPVEVRDKQGKINKKHPDIKLTHPGNGEEVYVEVTQLGSSRQQQLSSKCHETIWFLMHRAMDAGWSFDDGGREFYLPYSRLHRILEIDELENLAAQIKKFIEKVKTTKQFDQLYVEGTFECAIAPSGQHSQAERWAKDRGIQEHILEPTFVPADGLERAKYRIFEKMRQLPADKPGIIVIDYVENLTFWVYPMEFIISVIEDEAKLHSQLLGVVLLQRFGEGEREDESKTFGEHLVFKRKRSDSVAERLVFVKNILNSRPVSQTTYCKVLVAMSKF